MAKRYYKQVKYTGLQNETKQYIKRLSTYNRKLNSTDVADIDNFIKGLKQLNLLQNIIVYPLRSQHNIGSGANVLSFGGVGRFDGLSINSPSWGLSGINFTAASSQYIRIPNFLNSPVVAGFSMICIHQPDFTTAARALLGNDGSSATTRGIRINVQNHSYVTGTGVAANMFVTFPSSSTGVGSESAARTYIGYNTAAMHVNYVSFGGGLTTGLAASINSTTSTGTINLPFFNNTAFNTMGIGARNGLGAGADFFQGTMSLMMIANRAISPSEYLNVYALIRTTIGKGLGLP
jgi:hypothetical protein